MSKLQQDRELLLDELIDLCKQGQAENEPEDEQAFLRHFLPIRVHYRILEPDVQLIIGDKGAGKTQVFRALSYARGREALTRLAALHGRNAVDLKRAAWQIGFASSGQEFPPGTVLRLFASKRQPVDLQSFWLALLIRVLCQANEVRFTELPAPLQAPMRGLSPQIDSWYALLDAHLGALFAVLDATDRRLQEEDRYLFIIYDDLDRVSPGDWKTLQTVLQGLVQFWAASGRRYKRLRPKLFLRRDLYERAALFGPDIAKIAAHRVELLWDTREFYGVLFKRILNSTGELAGFLGSSLPRAESSQELGKIPLLDSELPFAPAVEKLFGKYMGPDARKGFTFRWVPNHLKDGHRRIYPRPLLRLVEAAAELEKRDGKAHHMGQLIHHTSLRGALDKVSEYRVQELTQEEFPWLNRIQATLFHASFVVPAERRVVLKSLNIPWGEAEDRPPSTEPSDILEYLVKLGIFQTRLDGRIDVGDLYLRGLHLKRKGGVARPKEKG
jgi:hypothetical protein